MVFPALTTMQILRLPNNFFVWMLYVIAKGMFKKHLIGLGKMVLGDIDSIY